MDAGFIEAAKHAMGDFGCCVQNESLLGVLVRRRDASCKFVLQGGVLNVKTLGQKHDA